jgi:formylglycine-generating enzyme required for sulfatase activity
MGCEEVLDGPCAAVETPSRTVTVRGFFLDRTEVTVADFQACVRAGACEPAPTMGECNAGEPDRDHFPINCVTWDQAGAYCEWAGRRLPTEAEWEKGARGTDGRAFPWGNEAPDADDIYRANWGEGLARHLWVRDRWEYDAPVGTFPEGASPYGALDMAGNLGEWVGDWFAPGYDTSDLRDPGGPSSGYSRVTRGGSFREYARRMKTFSRGDHRPGDWFGHVGFRCAADIP